MYLKSKILSLANAVLRLFNAKIVKTQDDFSMQSAIRRIAEHGITISTIIDIGASDGKWSLNTMKVFKNQSFLAIEPLRERFDALEYCKQYHRKFDYELCAAGESNDGYVTLNVQSDDIDGSTIDATGGEQRQVPVRTVDAIVAENNLEGPFLMKFDTHGYEVAILKGANNTLKNTNLIIMETYNFNITEHALLFYEMCSHMKKLGFRCYDIAAPMIRLYDKSFWQVDLFFCRIDSPIFSYSQYK